MLNNHNPTEDDDRSWFDFVAAKNDDQPAEILIYDYIGSFGVNAANFDRDLKAMGVPKSKKATMRINSPGGETPTAASIYNMMERWLAKHEIELTVVIDGIAASAASWIAMLGDEVIMPENTLMMIHDPAGFAMGTSREMRSLAAVLDRIKQGMVVAYMRKSGQSKEDVEAIMEAETWYSAEEAVIAGFADRVDNPIEIAASFDLTRFKHPPDGLEVGSRTPVSAAKEKVMPTNSNKQESPAEMETRIRAEVTAEMATKAPATSAAPAAADAAAAETPQQMEERIRGQVTASNAEINSLCVIAGKPEMAATYVAQGKTVVEVRAALEALAKAPAPAAAGSGLNTHTGAADSEAAKDALKQMTSGPIDSVAIYRNYNNHGKGTPVSYQK